MITYTPPPDKGLDILYADNLLLAINKPCGLLSVPGRGKDKQDCVISRVLKEYPSALIVHRLDMSTSGILVLALNKNIQRLLSEMFALQKIKKKYTAIVDGVLAKNDGEITQALICDWPNRPKQKVDNSIGKASCTCYRVIKSDQENNTSRVELEPKTGRTHQLRVHMQYLGHAILGDELYASNEVIRKSKRLMLHASTIAFQHPGDNSILRIDSTVPF